MLLFRPVSREKRATSFFLMREHKCARSTLHFQKEGPFASYFSFPSKTYRPGQANVLFSLCESLSEKLQIGLPRSVLHTTYFTENDSASFAATHSVGLLNETLRLVF